ncbi:MAG: hypothetical protein DWI57_00115 [Chloroflexi bacterium]|nr:MAG: hypothetical protein DWI57_00115 [Chloroflexota bacterium]
MPDISIGVPHYPQSNPGACLPACVRMVLAVYGKVHSERQIAVWLESYEFGTPAYHVEKLRRFGYSVDYRVSSLADLRQALQKGIVPIVFVHAGFLPWTDFEGFHAVVVSGITEVEGEISLRLNDPSMLTGGQVLLFDGFMLVWEEFDRRAAFITRSK